MKFKAIQQEFAKSLSRLLCWRRGLKWRKVKVHIEFAKSPPLLEAWIEICSVSSSHAARGVASFVGGVD